jgi:hypothetical protein
MSSLKVEIKEQLQLCSKFLVYINFPMRVKEDRSNLKLFLQKTNLKESLLKPYLKIKVEQVEREAPTPQVVLQKSYLNIKVEHVEKASKYANFEN